MKKIPLLSVVLLASFAFSASAQEGALKTAPLAGIQDSVPAQFNIVITGSGKLIVNPGAVFTEGEEEPGTILPTLISDPNPILYPKEALAQGWQGKAIIAVEVLADGSVGLYQIMQSTGYEVLDQVAIQALESWKFHPAVKADGQSFRTCIQIPITFQLEDE